MGVLRRSMPAAPTGAGVRSGSPSRSRRFTHFIWSLRRSLVVTVAVVDVGQMLMLVREGEVAVLLAVNDLDRVR